jgi:USP8 interacting
MKNMKSVIGLFLVAVTFTACTKAFYIDGKKAQAVKITDLGEMYATYNLSQAEKTEVSRQLNEKSLLDVIIRYTKENTWPDAVNTLDDRLANRKTMERYNFYKVASFGNKTIVSVPAEKNQHMPAAYIPQGPMYIIFSSSVVASK